MPSSVLYTRVSTDEQAKTGQSLESQQRACKDFAERNNYEVLETFREEGASAKSTDRKELLRMLNFCKDNKDKVDAVIVWKVDRFARKAEDHLTLKMFLTKLNIRLLSVTEPIEDTTTGRLMETMLAGFAQFDNEVRTERSTNGLRARIDQGGWVAYAPLGYENTRDSLGRPTLKIKSDVSDLIIQVFKQYATGAYTQPQIADYAYKIGLRSRGKNGKLSTQTIVNMLRNTAYNGRRKDSSTGELIKSLHQPIVNDDLFYDVQSVLNGRHKEFRQPKDKNWPLRAGFVRCSSCHLPITGSSPKGRSKSYPKYSCSHCKASVTGKPVSIDRELLHKEFSKILENIRPKQRNLELFKRVVLLRWNDEYKEISGEKSRIEKDLTALQSRRERVLDLFIDDKLAETDKDRQLEKIDSERAVLRIQRGELEREVDDRELVLGVGIDFMKNVSSYWERAPIELQRRFQNLVFPNGIEYEFGKGFGTAKLGVSYEVMEQIVSKNPSMVGDSWSVWNQLKSYLMEVYQLHQEVNRSSEVSA